MSIMLTGSWLGVKTMAMMASASMAYLRTLRMRLWSTTRAHDSSSMTKGSSKTMPNASRNSETKLM